MLRNVGCSGRRRDGGRLSSDFLPEGTWTFLDLATSFEGGKKNNVKQTWWSSLLHVVVFLLQILLSVLCFGVTFSWLSDLIIDIYTSSNYCQSGRQFGWFPQRHGWGARWGPFPNLQAPSTVTNKSLLGVSPVSFSTLEITGSYWPLVFSWFSESCSGANRNPGGDSVRYGKSGDWFCLVSLEISVALLPKFNHSLKLHFDVTADSPGVCFFRHRFTRIRVPGTKTIFSLRMGPTWPILNDRDNSIGLPRSLTTYKREAFSRSWVRYRRISFLWLTSLECSCAIWVFSLVNCTGLDPHRQETTDPRIIFQMIGKSTILCHITS